MQPSRQGQATRGIYTFVPQQENYWNNHPQPFLHPAFHPQYRQDGQKFQALPLPQNAQGPLVPMPLRMPQMHPTLQLTTPQHARHFLPSPAAQHPYPSQTYSPSLASQQPYHTQNFNPLGDPSRVAQIPNGNRSRLISQTPVAYTTENIFLTVPPQSQHHPRAPYPTLRPTPPSSGQALKFAHHYGSTPSQSSMPKSTRNLQLAYKQMRAAIGMQMHRAKVDSILAQERGSVNAGRKRSTTRIAATQRLQRYPGAASGPDAGPSNTVQQPMDVIDLTTDSPRQSLARLSSEWPLNDSSMYAPPVSQARASLPHARVPAQVSQFIMAEPMSMGSLLVGKNPALFSATENNSTSAAIDQPCTPMQVGEVSPKLPAKESQPSQSINATNTDSRTSPDDDAPAKDDNEWADHGLFTYDDCIASMARKADLTDKYHVAFDGSLPDDEEMSGTVLTIFSAIGRL